MTPRRRLPRPRRRAQRGRGLRDGKPFPPRRPDELTWSPGCAEACRRLRGRWRLVLVCVTNQPDMARGLQTENGGRHQRAARGSSVDAVLRVPPRRRRRVRLPQAAARHAARAAGTSTSTSHGASWSATAGRISRLARPRAAVTVSSTAGIRSSGPSEPDRSSPNCRRRSEWVMSKLAPQMTVAGGSRQRTCA